MRWTREKPNAPGWYWCRGPGDDGEQWEAIVRVDEYVDPDELGCSWLTSPTTAGLVMRPNWQNDVEWAGPIDPPIESDEIVVDARVLELEGHLNWLGWDSDGVERARKRIAELEQFVVDVTWIPTGESGCEVCSFCNAFKMGCDEDATEYPHDEDCPVGKINPGTTNRATR